MTKAAFTICMALLCLNISLAQHERPLYVDYEMSTPFKVVDAPTKLYFSQDGKILSLKYTPKEIILQKFDSERMEQVDRTEIELPKDGVLEGFYKIGKGYYVFYSEYDKRNTSEQLFCREVGFESCQWVGEASRLIATDDKIARSYGSGKFSFEFSNDSSKFLVRYRMVPDKKRDAINYDQIGMYVFNNQIEKQWGEMVEMPYTEKKMNNIGYSVDHKGNVYLLARVFDDNTTRTASRNNKSEPNYHMEIMIKTPESREFSTTAIELEGNFITSIWINETPNHEIVCAGFYNHTNSTSAAEGIYYIKLDSKGKVHSETHHEIPLEILNMYAGKRTQKRNNKKDEKGESEFTNLYLSDIIFNEDGSVVLLGEQHYSVTHTHTTANGGTSSSTTYYNNDIFLTKLSATGKLEWMNKLPKRQKGKRPQGGMSYNHFYSDGKHYLFFLDNVKNKHLRRETVPEYYIDGRFGQLTAYIVDDSRGTINKEAILDLENVETKKLYQFTVDRLLQVSPNDFVFEAYKKKKEDVIVKVHIGS